MVEASDRTVVAEESDSTLWLRHLTLVVEASDGTKWVRHPAARGWLRRLTARLR